MRYLIVGTKRLDLCSAFYICQNQIYTTPFMPDMVYSYCEISETGITSNVMKRRKEMANHKFTSVVIASILAASSLAACAPAAPEAAGTAVPAGQPAAETAVETTAEETSEQETDGSWDGDITEINVSLLTGFFNQDDYPEVIEAMNEITEKSIGVRVNAKFNTMAEYGTQLGLDFASGEDMDVISVVAAPPADFLSLSANGQLMDITEYLEEDGKETLELFGDYMGAASIGGSIYMVPCWRNYAGGTYITMRTDTLEELGLLETAENLSDWNTYEQIMKEVADKTDLSPIVGTQYIITANGTINGGETFADTINYDYLGDVLYLVYTDDDGNVSLLPETDAFKAQAERVRRWYDEGLVYKDSATLTDTDNNALVSGGVAFSFYTPGEFGAAERMTARLGMEMTTIVVSKQATGSAPVVRFGLAVPVTSSEPEAAVRWINALNTDPALENLIIWGIEGKHYVVENGEAVFPEGVDESNTTYHSNDFLYGNFFNCLPWKGQGADFREQAKAYLDGAPISPYLGFAADTSGLSNTIAALTTVTERYRGMINCGLYSDDDYEEYLSQLHAAGVDEYLQAYQDQLDAWKAAR